MCVSAREEIRFPSVAGDVRSRSDLSALPHQKQFETPVLLDLLQDCSSSLDNPLGDGQQWIGLSTGTARVLTRLAPTRWWGENTLVTFAYRIMLNTKGCEKMSMNSDRRCASIRLLSSAKENPHEMASEKGNVKIGRKIRPPQIIEKIGSSGWTRTSNPPVNRRKKKR